MTALMLFTHDLRVADNLTLIKAAQEPNLICAVLRQDTSDWGATKRNYYQACLGDLASSLDKAGHKLHVIDSLKDFDRVYCTRRYNSRDKSRIQHPSLVEVDQGTLYKESELPFSLEKLPKTFTPFRYKLDKVVKQPMPPLAAPKLPPSPRCHLEHIEPTQGGGETAAQKRLSAYFQSDHPLSYFETRNGMLNANDSTKFSPHLAWGCISPERIYYELKQYEQQRGQNKSTYWILFELYWRDYFKFISLKFGDKIFNLTGTSERTLPRLDKQKEQTLFNEWASGNTEEPFVNANMNELNQTGWMSNRGRQNVASFLTKTKGVSWLLGARYFEQHLIDFDIESNYGNWAYIAGVGVDPRDRVFNIKKQAAMYDPEQAYQRRWLS
jgi:deoxyribodipyrimidine photo-lyase